MLTDNKHPHHVVPLVDIYETDEGAIVYIDLPGAKKDQIKLNVEGDRLQLVCEKPDERPNLSKGLFYLMEREYGFFRRGLDLPPGLQPEKAEAKMVDGVLTIRIPRDITDNRFKA